jgi:2-oxo-4-hydroxy-4-carboxy-5-ureidoimidazoline decarboxylase
MQLGQFNQLAADAARERIDPCLGVRRWVDEVVQARPYADLAALVMQARASAENLTEPELEAALARHPRIGERADQREDDGLEAEFSRAEQAGVPTDADTAERLRAANRDYEQRFGRVFIVRAAGRTSDEILSELKRRLDQVPEVERRETVAALRDIAVLRLQHVVHP